ncbi:hypothetical protein BKA65DRAFT_267079 [Rhexocercosporidium sp. MPI-PUGE-AT-0058]|nr:hypothetical protein BKA65DRAFT_267079 [Rhexocercosporidium sp. MPI-PUGE-AT-0058]
MRVTKRSAPAPASEATEPASLNFHRMMGIFGAIKGILSIRGPDSKHYDRLDVFETEESHGRVQRYFPRFSMKPATWRSTSGSDTNNTTMTGCLDDLATSQTVDHDSTSDGHQDSMAGNRKPRFLRTSKEDIPGICMHNLAMIGADQESRKSFSSDVINIYQKYIQLVDSDGRYFQVLVQFDTGASSSFISRGTLARIGTHTEYDIPDKYAYTYKSPIDPDASKKPIRYIEVQMANEELAFFDRKVRLKIIEVPSEFQIIIGRNKMHKHRKTGLLARLEQSESDIKDDEASPRIIFPLFKAHRTKDGKAIDAARDGRTNDETDQAFFERQRILQSSLYGTANAHWNGSWSAPQNASSNTHNPQPVPFRPHYSQTTNMPYAALPVHSPQMGINRRDTADSVSTQSTQNTQYSMGGQSFASSRTSYSNDTSAFTATWKATGPQPPGNESTQGAGQEDSRRLQ